MGDHQVAGRAHEAGGRQGSGQGRTGGAPAASKHSKKESSPVTGLRSNALIPPGKLAYAERPSALKATAPVRPRPWRAVHPGTGGPEAEL